jgi:hypothetical protein
MAALNDLLRFGLEIAGIVALAIWGWTAGGSGPLRLVFAVAAPLALVVIWAIFIAPNADSPLAPNVRILVGSGLLLVAAGGLWLAGHRELAVLFAIVNVVNTILMFVLPA